MNPPIIRSPPCSPPTLPSKPQRALSGSSDAAIIKSFWQKLRPKRAGQPCFVLPDSRIVEAAVSRMDHGKAHSIDANLYFEEAKRICKEKVERIARECRESNRKYRDYHFDLSKDGEVNRDCIDGLTNKWSMLKPMGVNRIGDIFEDPKFYINGATAGDIQQGKIGDCWFLAALATITNVEGLLERVCVARDEEVGVYGFIFYRDGEWISTIVDDQLYLKHPEFGTEVDHIGHIILETEIFRNSETEYQKAMVQGSRALYFSACEEQNETWLPLLEKAYAKVHGDYGVLIGGYAGEAVEDLTGGVTSEFYTRDILNKQKLWTEEFLEVNKKFLFAAVNNSSAGRAGIQKNHSYSVLRAVEVKGQKMVLLRNPWGKGEWTGAWSDGSKEWNAEWMTLLNHQFGNDGVFWMSFDDFLRKYTTIDRTRLFDDTWKVASKWAILGVEWAADYSDTRFEITVTKTGPLVIVIQQLDTRYFSGLEGIYDLQLYFRIQKEGETEYIRRSRSNIEMRRNVNTEVTLEPGIYWVLVKVTATKNPGGTTVSDSVKNYALDNREKFLKAAVSHDLAFAKGLPPMRDLEVRDSGNEMSEVGESVFTGGYAEYGGSEDVGDGGTRPEQMPPVPIRTPKGVDFSESAGPFSSAGGKADAGNTAAVETSNTEVQDNSPNTAQQLANVNDSIPKTDSIELPQGKENQFPKGAEGTAGRVFGEVEDPDTKRDHNDFDRPPYFDKRQFIYQHLRPPPILSPAPVPPPHPLVGDPRYPNSRYQEEEEDGVWDPVVVLGLRVYSQDPDLTADVVRPRHEEDELDLDDISRDAMHSGHAPSGIRLMQPMPRGRAKTSVPSWADI